MTWILLALVCSSLIACIPGFDLGLRFGFERPTVTGLNVIRSLFMHFFLLLSLLPLCLCNISDFFFAGVVVVTPDTPVL